MGAQVLEADLAILDEIDSGLDIDALRDVAAAVNGLRNPERGVLMITHYQRLLDYITPQFVHIMVCLPLLLLSLHMMARGFWCKSYTSFRPSFDSKEDRWFSASACC